jgi:solute carrier family 35 protein E3
MLIMCPFFDDVHALYQFEYSTPCILRILASCLFAIGVNISNYIVIGKTSPLTYQVLGHLKTVLILILGFIMFNKHVDMRNILGITLAMAGVMWYTEVRRKETNKANTVEEKEGSAATSTKKYGARDSDDEDVPMLKV